MFTFAWPWMILLLALPVLVRVLGSRAKAANTSGAPEIFFPYIDRLKAIFPKQQQAKETTRLYLAILALLWLSLTVALMRPEFVDQFMPLRNSGYDLLLAVDLSGSMEALDYTKKNGEQASRIQIVKTVVGDFVDQRQGDRVGLILFGSSAYLHVPLTLDTLSVRKMLDNAAVGEAGDMTAIGDAIALAVRTLRDRPEKSRIVVLLTDGGDNASTIPPLAAAKLAEQYGIRIYTIGVGSQGLVPIPDEVGQIQMQEFDLDEGLLRSIASITGGNYFRAADTNALQKIYAQINKLEKTQAETHSYIVRRTLYPYPLGLALALLLALSLLPILPRVRHGL
ncbi:MAG TPA: VWA domain-containing protein [Rhizomicrobium sp.]